MPWTPSARTLVSSPSLPESLSYSPHDIFNGTGLAARSCQYQKA